MGRIRVFLLFVLALIVITGPAAAQPFGAWLVKGSNQGYV